MNFKALIVTQLVLFFVPDTVQIERHFTVSIKYSTCDNSTWSTSSVSGAANCSGFTELLDIVSLNIASGDKVVISIEGGSEYYLKKPIFFLVENTSIVMQEVCPSPINGSGCNRPRIVCNLTDALASSDVLYALRFQYNNLVMLNRLEFFDCPRSLSFVDMLNLTVTNSLFRYFTEGVLSIAECNVVHLENVTVRDNTNTMLRTDSVDRLVSRGNAGGISIAYEILFFNDLAPMFNVINCDFINVSSTSSVPSSAFTTILVQTRVFAGTGGGLAIYLSDEKAITGNIVGCLFRNNFAMYYGGGLLLVENKRSTPGHTVAMVNNTFKQNQAVVGGGGIMLAYIANQTVGELLKVYISGCLFERNMARAGGGIIDLTSLRIGRVSQILIDDSVFVRNSARELGAAYAVISFAQSLTSPVRSPVANRIITNCTFINNRAVRGGVVTLLYFPVRFDGTNSFSGSTGPAVRVIGTIMSVNGTVLFTDNSAAQSDGGALYCTSFGQVQLHKGSHLNFTKNKGSYGSSIIVETQNVPVIFQQLVNNPLCFLLYEEVASPNEWSEVLMSFEENNAYVGPVAYLDKLNLCAWNSNQSPYFSLENVLKWNFVDYRKNNNINRGRSSDNKNEDYYIQTPAVNFAIEMMNNNNDYFPAQPIEVTVEAFDELQHFTTAFFRFTDSLISEGNVMAMLTEARRGGSSMNQPPPPPTMMSMAATDESFNNDESVLLDASPSLLVTEPKSKGYRLLYHFQSDSFIQDYHRFTRELSIDSPVLLNLAEKLISIRSKRCPPGNILKNISGVWGCRCNNDLDELVECVPQQGLLLLEGHWTYSYSDRDEIAFYECPPGYCRCDRLGNTTVDATCYAVLPDNNSDGQCVCDRKGILCGECRNGAGVSALLNECVECGNVNALLIVTLIIIDCIIVLVMLRWNYPFPTWLYPCLFYLQMAPYVTEDFPVTFSEAHRYLYYISSAVSLYFPYDFCLYHGATALESFAIRYIPFFVSLTIIIALVITRRFVYKLRQYRFRHGIWFLIVLQYSHVIHTSMSLLNCPSIPSNSTGNDNVVRWYWDGSVKCFHGNHIPMGLLALFVLMFGLSLIVAMIVSNLKFAPMKTKMPFTLSNFLRIVSVPGCVGFKSDCKWWAGVELGRRMVLLIFVIAFGHNKIPVLFILMIIFTVYTLICPYEELTTCIVESVLCGILILIILLRNTAHVLEQFLVLVSDSKEPVVFGSCGADSSGVTKLTALLTPFYYLFLVAPLGYCIVKFPHRQLWNFWWTKICEVNESQVDDDHDEKMEKKVYRVSEVSIGIGGEEVTVSSSIAFQ